jgi:hypothetical protein
MVSTHSKMAILQSIGQPSGGIYRSRWPATGFAVISLCHSDSLPFSTYSPVFLRTNHYKPLGLCMNYSQRIFWEDNKTQDNCSVLRGFEVSRDKGYG